MFDITKYSNFGIEATADNVFELPSLDKGLIDVATDTTLTVIGSGTNTIFTNGHVPALLKLTNDFIIRTSSTTLIADAGALLDDLIRASIGMGLSGGECLSGIPGTVGGAICLNAGAYGVTISQLVTSVEVYDRLLKKSYWISAQQAKFAHRTSIFRGSATCIILRAELRFSHFLTQPNHQKLDRQPYSTSSQIREHVLELRSYLPNTSTTRYVGSFFLNPILPNNKVLLNLLNAHGIAYRPYSECHIEISAGSILDSLGYKGLSTAHFMHHPKNANILLHTSGKASGNDVSSYIIHLQKHAYETYGITLSPEPVLL